jgi:hypothetical protein
MLHRLVVLLRAVVSATALLLFDVRSVPAQPVLCRATLDSGDDVVAALRSASAGDTVCLRPGEYRPVALTPGLAAGVTLRGAGRGVTIESLRGAALEVSGVERLSVADLTLRAPDGVGARIGGASGITIRNVRIEEAAVAVLLEGGSTARVEDSAVRRALDAGIVVRGGSRLLAERLLVTDAVTGVAVLSDGSEAVLRASRIGGGAGPAVYVGLPGCGEPVLGSTAAPVCYRERPAGSAGEAAVTLDGVTIEEGDGPGIVLHAGARAEVRRSQIYGRALGGLFAWGARLTLSDSVLEGNTGFGVELRAFPEPGGADSIVAAGTIERTAVRFTRPLGGGLLGDGIIVRGSTLRLLDSAVIANAANGVAVRSRSVAEVTGTRVLENRAAAVCASDDATAVVTDSPLVGNGADELARCNEPSMPTSFRHGGTEGRSV